MIRNVLLGFALVLMTQMAFASAGFQKRFQLVKNDQGQTVAIRLKALSLRFTLAPFIEQIKNDILSEQRRIKNLGFMGYESEVDARLAAMGMDPYSKDSEGAEEIRAVKESLMNIPNINVEESFLAIERSGLMAEFEKKIQDALLQLDLALVANLDDSRYFYRRNVVYAVVTWALEQAQKRFSSVPFLNLASFVIVKVHDLLHEQKTFHHNMMLHYFQNVSEAELGMSKSEVDRAVSSIYEYRIATTGLSESNRAAREWDVFGWNKFYVQLRQGNTRARALSQGSRYTDSKRVNFAFQESTSEGSRRIYNLLMNAHLFSSQPAMAYDYARPDKVRRDRALLNLAQVGLGFIPGIPGMLKSLANTFLDSMHKEQRLMDGALVAYFELNQNSVMVDQMYKQTINPYIVK